MIVLSGLLHDGKVEIDDPSLVKGMEGPVEVIVKATESVREDALQRFYRLNAELSALNIRLKDGESVERLADEAFYGLS